MTIWREFFEDDAHRGSSTRLCMIYGIFIGSLVVLWMTVQDTLTTEIFVTFMLASGGVYGWGKYRDSVEKTEQIKADSPNPPPPAIVNQPQPAPQTIIQVGDGQRTETANDVNMEVKGDVNVSNPKS